MLLFLSFIAIYSAMVFMWSFVYINRNTDQVNQAFLGFLSLVLLWMFLNVSEVYITDNITGILIKSVYFISMLNFSILFLNFIYRLINRKIDRLFSVFLLTNIVNILVRYLFPIDYSADNFWRMDDPVVAPIMATIFSLPIIYAIYLIIRQLKTTQDNRQRSQLKYVLSGIALATVISIISEYLLPAVLKFSPQFSLMYLALFVLVIFLYLSIIKHKFLNVNADYIYQKLFLRSNQGIILINKDARIMSINNAAREIFQDQNFTEGALITKYIQDYDFAKDYNKREVSISTQEKTHYLSLTQSPIETREQGSVKLLHIVDITPETQLRQAEKSALVEKSTIDQLTGLYNKNYIINNYASGLSEQDRHLNVMFIDIDQFKFVNDNYGHLAGDQVLQRVAQIIKQSLRIEEKAIRYGGDEFVVIFENSKKSDVFMIAERIRRKVENNDEGEVTLSIGISEGVGSINTLIEQADAAMYYAKSNGKNQCSIYDATLMPINGRE